MFILRFYLVFALVKTVTKYLQNILNEKIKKNDMAKRTPIEVRYGKIKEQQCLTGASKTTVWHVLRRHSDTEKENQICQMAKD